MTFTQKAIIAGTATTALATMMVVAAAPSVPTGAVSSQMTLSKSSFTFLPKDKTRTYAQLCNNNNANPPIYFYVTASDTPQAQVPQGTCWTSTDSKVWDDIRVLASTSLPSNVPAVLNITKD